MTQTNLEIVQSRLEGLKANGKYQTEALEQLKQRYLIDKAQDVMKVPTSKLIGYDFQYEMELGAKRLKRIEIIKSGVVKLERHAYAPELNCLHFVTGNTFRVNGLTEMDEAILFAAISLSDEQIKKYIGAN